MSELFEKQKDGSLKPIDHPEWLVKKLATYKWLKGENLTLEEIKIVLLEMPSGD